MKDKGWRPTKAWSSLARLCDFQIERGANEPSRSILPEHEMSRKKSNRQREHSSSQPERPTVSVKILRADVYGHQRHCRNAGGVLQDGSWNNNDNKARSANPSRNNPTNTNNNLGFRCFLTSVITFDRNTACSRTRRACQGPVRLQGRANTKKAHRLEHNFPR